MALSNADKKAAFIARRADIGSIPAPADPARREACRNDLLLFGLTYFQQPQSGAFLQRPPSVRMHRYIRLLQESHTDDRMVHVRWPRGKGKTSWLKIAALWSAAFGHRRYMFVGAANQESAESILRDIWDAIEQAELFGADFPEIALPIRHLDGRMQRRAVQTCNGERTRIERGTDKIGFPRIAGAESSGAIIIARGMEAGTRGLVKGSQRPDHIAIDDPQTRKTAKSPAAHSAISAWIQGDVLGLGGHNRSVSGVMTSTPMYAGDVSEMYADPDLHPEWSTVSEPMVISWPEREDLWEQYLDLRRRDELGGVSNFENATAFYRDNREEMDRGADLLDPDDGDPKTELSGLQHVYNLLFKHGREAFDAEFQLAPRKSDTAFELSAKQVSANISGTGRFVLPKCFHAATAFIDCMDADGLRWVVLGIGPQRMCCVLGYGRYPESGTLYPEKALVPEQNKIFAGMLSGLVEMLATQQITRADGGRPITLSGVAVDRGWKPRIVEWVLRKSKHASICFASLGYGWSKFAPTRQDGKSKAGVIGIGDHCYLSDNGHFRYVGHHADYWREYAQRSFLALPLTAGATAIYGGDDLEHYDFAREICSEVLADKGAGTNGTEFWRYVKGPGAKNHYLDCVVGCMVLASWLRLYDATQTLAGNIGQARAAGNHRRKLKLIRR